MKEHCFSRQICFGILVLSLLCGSLAAESVWNAPLPVAADGSRELTVTSENKESNKLVSFPLDAKKIAGRRLILSADVRMDLEHSPVAMAGAKLMINGKRADTSFYSRSPLPRGKSDWKSVRFVIDIPHDLQKTIVPWRIASWISARKACRVRRRNFCNPVMRARKKSY